MPDPTPAIIESANLFREALLRRERQSATALTYYYGATWTRLQSDLNNLQAQIQQMRDAGEKVTEARIWKLERLKAVQQQADAEIARFADFADTTIQAGKRESVAAGERDAPRLVQAAFPPDAEISIEFGRMSARAVETLVGFTRDGSPLKALIDKRVGPAADGFVTELVTGLARGLNPREVARNIRGAYGIGLSDALRISRTEQLRAYRESSRQSYKSSGVVKEYERLAAHNDRTCMACFVDWKVPILTSQGFKPIAKVEIGDLVLTHRGRFRRVTETMRQSVEQADIVTIRVQVPGGKQLDSLTMTVEHPVLTRRGWMRADSLLDDDVVGIPTKSCEVCGKPIPYRYKGGKVCSRSCVGKLGAAGLHNDPEAHHRAIANMTKTHHEMMRRGEHPFQDPEVMIRRARLALQANSRLVSSRTEGKLGEAFDEIGLEYETQYPIFSHYNQSNKRRYHYYADFAFPEERVIVEADGEPWHSWDERRKAHDRRRQRRIEKRGWQVLRYTGQQIQQDVQGIAQEVKAILMNHQGDYGIQYVPIKSIVRGVRKPPSPDFKVVRYNLEVEEDHSYVAKYAIVHNCIVLDGKRYELEEEFDDHVAGRCAIICVTKSYREMGIDVDEPDFTREKGIDWFNRQTEATQRHMMGKGKYEAWKDGKFQLTDIPKLVTNAVWGNSWVPRSLKDLLESAAGPHPKSQAERDLQAEIDEIKPIYDEMVAAGDPTGGGLNGYLDSLQENLKEEQQINQALWEQLRIVPGDATTEDWRKVADTLEKEGYDLYKQYTKEGIKLFVAEKRGAKESGYMVVGKEQILVRRGRFSAREAIRIEGEIWAGAKEKMSGAMGEMLGRMGFSEQDIAQADYFQRQRLLAEVGNKEMSQTKSGRTTRIDLVPVSAREQVIQVVDYDLAAIAATSAADPLTLPSLDAYGKMELADRIRKAKVPPEQESGFVSELQF